MFYSVSQNNSGGYYLTDAGVAEYMRTDDRRQAFVHYADGRIVPVGNAVKAEQDAEDAGCEAGCPHCEMVGRMNDMLGRVND